MSRLVRAIALTSFVFAATGAFAGELPAIQTVFQFHGLTCRNLHGSELNYATVVRYVFGSEYPLWNWQLTPAATGPHYKLIVQLRAQRSGNHTTYYLDYFRDLPGFADQMADLGRKAFYEWDERERPCTDPQFQARLQRRLFEDLAASGARFRELFQKHVPISTKAPEKSNTEAKVVTIDVPWRKLHAGFQSNIEVMVGETLRAVLTPIKQHVNGNAEPIVCASVVKFYLDDSEISPDDSRVAEILKSDGKRRDVQVVMAIYERNSDSDKPQSTVLAPGQPVVNPE